MSPRQLKLGSLPLPRGSLESEFNGLLSDIYTRCCRARRAGEKGITAAPSPQMDYVSRTCADALLERGAKDATNSWQIRSDTSLEFWMRAEPY